MKYLAILIVASVVALGLGMGAGFPINEPPEPISSNYEECIEKEIHEFEGIIPDNNMLAFVANYMIEQCGLAPRRNLEERSRVKYRLMKRNHKVEELRCE